MAQSANTGWSRFGSVISSVTPAGWVKIVSIGLIIIGLMLLIRALPMGPAVEALMAWVDRLGVFGPVVFAGVYFLATLLMLPVWVLSVAGGMLFGLAGGVLTVVCSLPSSWWSM